MMVAENQGHPGVWRQTGQCKTTRNCRFDDLDVQYLTAVDAMARWDGTLSLDAHPLRRRQRDRNNRDLMRLHPDLSLLVLEALPWHLDDLDLQEAWRACRDAPRTLLGFDAPRHDPPMDWPAMLLRELVAGFVSQAVDA